MSHPVTVSLKELRDGVSMKTLQAAFGPDSLGIIVVSGLPQDFPLLRERVLTSMCRLANLPAELLQELENEAAMWLTGWSRGREVLSASGQPDFNKGSFYMNCAFHSDPTLEAPPEKLAKNFPEYPTYTAPNIWPSEAAPGLESFQKDCKALCNLMIDVAAEVAQNCDNYILAQNSQYERGTLKRIVDTSTCTKARLLHYYPGDDEWCGEHTDHGCLTGLTSALFQREQNGLHAPLDRSPDPLSGLYVKDRRGEIVQVSIPKDCLAFQSGLALEELSQGSLRAVSHFVRGSSDPQVSRNTIAVFCQPDLDEKINERENFAQFADRVLKEHH